MRRNIIVFDLKGLGLLRGKELHWGSMSTLFLLLTSENQLALAARELGAHGVHVMLALLTIATIPELFFGLLRAVGILHKPWLRVILVTGLSVREGCLREIY